MFGFCTSLTYVVVVACTVLVEGEGAVGQRGACLFLAPNSTLKSVCFPVVLAGRMSPATVENLRVLLLTDCGVAVVGLCVMACLRGPVRPGCVQRGTLARVASNLTHILLAWTVVLFYLQLSALASDQQWSPRPCDPLRARSVALPPQWASLGCCPHKRTQTTSLWLAMMLPTKAAGQELDPASLAPVDPSGSLAGPSDSSPSAIMTCVEARLNGSAFPPARFFRGFQVFAQVLLFWLLAVRYALYENTCTKQRQRFDVFGSSQRLDAARTAISV